jgi:hypothetical protein
MGPDKSELLRSACRSLHRMSIAGMTRLGPQDSDTKGRDLQRLEDMDLVCILTEMLARILRSTPLRPIDAEEYSDDCFAPSQAHRAQHGSKGSLRLRLALPPEKSQDASLSPNAFRERSAYTVTLSSLLCCLGATHPPSRKQIAWTQRIFWVENTGSTTGLAHGGRGEPR